MILIKNGNKYESPFPFIHFDEVLDPTFFSQLRENFPSDIFYENILAVQGNRRDIGRFSKEFKKFINSNEPWKELYKFSQSKAFCSLLLNQFKNNWSELEIENVKNFKFSNSILGYENRVKRLKNSVIKNKFFVSVLDLLKSREPLSVSFSLGTSGMGYHSPPHIDARHKIIAFLIYFDDNTGADKLNIFSPVQNEIPEYDKNNFALSELELFKEIIPKPNTGILLWNNYKSIHSVPLIDRELISKRRFLYMSIASSRRLDCWKR